VPPLGVVDHLLGIALGRPADGRVVKRPA